MLFGEYAVLEGHPAIVAALDKRITVTITPNKTNAIIIDSEHLGHYETSLELLSIQDPFKFVLAALQYHASKLPSGCNIHISSEIGHQSGLGSSAAVLVATLGAIHQWLNKTINNKKILSIAKELIIQVQGAGSAADAAASVYGGILLYHPVSLKVKSYARHPSLYLLDSGIRSHTSTAIKNWKNYHKELPKLYSGLTEVMKKCVSDADRYFSKADWTKVGTLMNFYQGLLECAGASNQSLSHMIYLARNQSEVLGSKISGAGYGDSIVALTTQSLFLYPSQPVVIAQTGLTCE